jgi:hypothetical protein
MTREVNARAGQEEGQGDAAGSAPQQLSYRALEQMLERFGGSNTRVALVAMPVMNPFAIDERLCDVMENTPSLLIDMRYAVPSSDVFYRDNLPLNEEGARLFSETLATQLRSPRPSMSFCPI